MSRAAPTPPATPYKSALYRDNPAQRGQTAPSCLAASSRPWSYRSGPAKPTATRWRAGRWLIEGGRSKKPACRHRPYRPVLLPAGPVGLYPPAFACPALLGVPLARLFHSVPDRSPSHFRKIEEHARRKGWCSYAWISVVAVSLKKKQETEQ